MAPPVPPPVFKDCFGLPQAVADKMPVNMLIGSGALQGPFAVEHLNRLRAYELAVHAGLAEGYTAFAYDPIAQNFSLASFTDGDSVSH